MFLFLAFFGLSTREIYYFPGIAESNLSATFTNVSLFEKCKNFENNKKYLIWSSKSEIDEECLSSILDTEIDSAEKTVKTPSGVEISTDGIVKGINVDILKSSTYDQFPLYTVNYDWVHFYLLSNQTFEELKLSIQKSSDKAVLVGFSLGANFIARFLNTYVDNKWKEEHIKSVALLAPEIGGSFSALAAAGLHPELLSDNLPNQTFVRHAPVVYGLFPNFLLNQNVITKDGKSYGAADVFGLLKDNGLTDEVSEAIYQYVENDLNTDLATRDLSVETLIVYNSDIQTLAAVNITENGHYTEIKKSGDGSVPADNVKYLCDNWKNAQCQDILSHNVEHSAFITNAYVASLLNDFIIDQKSKNQAIIIVCSIIGGIVFAGIISAFVILWIIKKAKTLGVDLEENLIDQDDHQ